MKCHTCHTDVLLTHRVDILDLVENDAQDPPKAFRTAFVCGTCYACLDTVDAVGLIDGRMYKLHEYSRFGKATLYGRSMFDYYQRREALSWSRPTPAEARSPSAPDFKVEWDVNQVARVRNVRLVEVNHS